MSDEKRIPEEESHHREEGAAESKPLRVSIDEWKGRIALSVLISIVWAVKLTSQTRTVHDAVIIWLIFAVACGLVLVPLGEPLWGWWGDRLRTVIGSSIALLLTLLVLFFGPLLLNIPGLLASAPSVGIVEGTNQQITEPRQYRVPAIELSQDEPNASITPVDGSVTVDISALLKEGPEVSSWAFFQLILFTAAASTPVILVSMLARDQILAGIVASFRFGADGLERVDRMVRLMATILAGLGVIIGVLAL